MIKVKFITKSNTSVIRFPVWSGSIYTSVYLHKCLKFVKFDRSLLVTISGANYLQFCDLEKKIPMLESWNYYYRQVVYLLATNYKLCEQFTVSWSKNEIWADCMIYIAGLDHNALARTLETTLIQPGIKPELVTVRTLSHATCVVACNASIASVAFFYFFFFTKF